MSKIYVPSDYLNDCHVFSDNYIRSYTNSSRTEWVDIYYKDDYSLRPGFSNYSQNVVCDTLNTYTDDYYYRYDFPNILLMFLIFSIFCFLIPFKIFSKLFKGGSL